MYITCYLPRYQVNESTGYFYTLCQGTHTEREWRSHSNTRCCFVLSATRLLVLPELLTDLLQPNERAWCSTIDSLILLVSQMHYMSLYTSTVRRVFMIFLHQILNLVLNVRGLMFQILIIGPLWVLLFLVCSFSSPPLSSHFYYHQFSSFLLSLNWSIKNISFVTRILMIQRKQSNTIKCFHSCLTMVVMMLLGSSVIWHDEGLEKFI